MKWDALQPYIRARFPLADERMGNWGITIIVVCGDRIIRGRAETVRHSMQQAAAAQFKRSRTVSNISPISRCIDSNKFLHPCRKDFDTERLSINRSKYGNVFGSMLQIVLSSLLAYVHPVTNIRHLLYSRWERQEQPAGDESTELFPAMRNWERTQHVLWIG